MVSGLVVSLFEQQGSNSSTLDNSPFRTTWFLQLLFVVTVLVVFLTQHCLIAARINEELEEHT
jgi:hypothetical protein